MLECVSFNLYGPLIPDYNKLSTGRSNLPPPLDLPGATKLKDLGFLMRSLNTQWITRTLQTAKSENLRNIIIQLDESDDMMPVRLEWQDVDDLLVELWTSRSILPGIKYNNGEDGIWRKFVASLLPKLTGIGVVEAVG